MIRAHPPALSIPEISALDHRSKWADDIGPDSQLAEDSLNQPHSHIQLAKERNTNLTRTVSVLPSIKRKYPPDMRRISQASPAPHTPACNVEVAERQATTRDSLGKKSSHSLQHCFEGERGFKYPRPKKRELCATRPHHVKWVHPFY